MKHRIMALAWTCVCAIGCTSAVAQSTNEAAVKTRLEQVANSYTAGNAFMGAVLVVDGERVLLNKGYGMADLEWGNPDEPDVKFRLGSLTKQFTATLVLLLQQEGKLNIDDLVSKYLTDSPKTWEKITLANLLGHTSGIPNFTAPNFTATKEFSGWQMSPHTPQEELAFLALFRDKPLDFQPGSQFNYSNTNYEVLGAVIEKVSGKSYSDLLREHIFDPLGMKDTGLDTDNLLLPKRARGYTPAKNGLVVARFESMAVPWAAGAMYSTTGDLLKWEHGLFGGKVLSAASLNAMTTPGLGDYEGNYGLGVFIAKKGMLKVVQHSGGIQGFNTNLIYVPERRIAVVVLANVNGDAADAMGDQLLDVVLGNPVTLVTERKAVAITNEQLMRFVGVFDLDAMPSFKFGVSGGSLTEQGPYPGQRAVPLLYLGVKEGHPRFFLAGANAQVEFVPDASGAYTSIVIHRGGQLDTLAQRHQ